jgi:NodT family efflux transporter outer membrane factor (OMF) lipoprotein
VTIVDIKRGKTASRLLMMVLSLTAGGCMVGLNYDTPKTKAPERFGEASTTQPTVPLNITHWWKSFNDPELDRLIDRAVVNNNTLLQAEMRVRQARAQLGVEWGTEFPTLSANANVERQQTSRNLSTASVLGGTTGSTGTGTGSTGTGTTSVSGSSFSRRSNLFKGTFDSSWEIDVFGGNRRAIESAGYDLEAQIDARRYALVTLTAEVANDYCLLRGYQTQLKLTKDNAKSEQDTLQLTQSRFKAGLVSDLDVAQAEASVATTIAQEPALEILIKQRIHAISILLGEQPMALADELGTSQPVPPIPTEIPVGLPSDLLRRRPDVRESERLLAESTANIGVAVANLFPKFSLTGSLGQESSRLGLIARDASNIWSIGPSMSWQILDYNQLQSEVRVTNAEQQEALYSYRQTVLQSFSDVEDALVAYAQDQVRSKAINDEVVADQRAVDLSIQLYQRGLGDFLNVLTAQRSLYTAQSDLSVSESSVSTDLVALYKALGGGWDEHDEENFKKFEDPKIPVAMR